MQPGDWLRGIADTHGMTVEDLLRLNPDIPRDTLLIVPGQVLLLSAEDDDAHDEPDEPSAESPEAEGDDQSSGDAEDAVEDAEPTAEATGGEDRGGATVPSADEPSPIESASPEPTPTPVRDDAARETGDSDTATLVGVAVAGVLGGALLGAGGSVAWRKRRGGEE